MLDHKQAFVLGLGAAEQWLESDSVGILVRAVDPVHCATREIVPWGVSRSVSDLAGTKLFEIVRGRHAGSVEKILVLANTVCASLGTIALRVRPGGRHRGVVD